ncbi:MAG: glucose-6-phosphate dehydrogenase, partial [Erysipelothrix sp.]|nr:glucose-6-phosphate dehydrogenase [Erysipelothrix sp.]
MTGLDSNHPNVFVIFGGTGDLTYRKLLPAFYDLVLQGVFDANNLKIVIIGRRDYNSQTFLERALTGIEANARFKKEDLEAKQKLSQMVSYYKMDYHDLASYAGLREYLSSLFET